MIAPSPAAPAHKRPRGLWKGRREAALLPRPDPAARSHAHDDLEHCASTSTYSFDSYYDDDPDDRASSSSYSRPASSKRRRISPADSDTLWHYSPVSRSPSPDPLDDAPCCSAQIADDFLRPAMQFHHKPDPYASINRQDKGQPLPFTSDLEEWESLKALFARAYQSYEDDDPSESLPLLRAVIRACHLFLLAHPDPSLVFVEPPPPRDSRSPELMTPAEERLLRDWAAAADPYDAPRRPPLAHMPSASSASSMPLPNGHAHNHTHAHTHNHNHTHPPKKPTDPPTAFHALFGTALYLVGTLLAASPALALPDEPRAPSTYWLAALDVFETGENTPAVVHADARARPARAEDWRMAVAWGRTLVCLAEEKLRHAHDLAEGHGHGHDAAPGTPSPGRDLANGWCAYAPSAGPFSHTEPRWPASSPFHAVAVARPPVTRRMSLWGASAHDVLVLAMDQFARGIFHMPHPHYSASHNPTGLQLEEGVGGGGMRGPGGGGMKGPGGGGAFYGRGPGGTTPASRLSSLPPSSSSQPPTDLPFSRPKELFTIASSLLSVAERLSRGPQREYWASQADSVFNQMKMEADMDVSRAAVNAARGRCWLVVGEARAEELEGALERGEGGVLWSAEAEEAREGLGMAITFFTRAKGSAKKRFNYGYGRRGAGEEEGAVGELGPLLAEAMVTLGNLTADEARREALYVRAQGEVGVDLGLGPEETASESDGESAGGDGDEATDAQRVKAEREQQEKEKEAADDAFAAAEAARIIAEAAEAYAREERAGVAGAVGVRVVGGAAVPAPVPVPMSMPAPVPVPVPMSMPVPVPTVPVEISMGLGGGGREREGGADGALAVLSGNTWARGRERRGSEQGVGSPDAMAVSPTLASTSPRTRTRTSGSAASPRTRSPAATRRGSRSAGAGSPTVPMAVSPTLASASTSPTVVPSTRTASPVAPAPIPTTSVTVTAPSAARRTTSRSTTSSHTSSHPNAHTNAPTMSRSTSTSTSAHAHAHAPAMSRSTSMNAPALPAAARCSGKRKRGAEDAGVGAGAMRRSRSQEEREGEDRMDVS